MNICEGCVKSDVCKFKNKVEKKYELEKDIYSNIGEPIVANLFCRYKEAKKSDSITVWNDAGTTTDYPWGNATWTCACN